MTYGYPQGPASGSDLPRWGTRFKPSFTVVIGATAVAAAAITFAAVGWHELAHQALGLDDHPPGAAVSSHRRAEAAGRSAVDGSVPRAAFAWRGPM
jgi:hypothetical protein